MNPGKYFFAAIMATILLACGSKKENSGPVTVKPPEEPSESSYVNYTALLQEQVRLVDSTPLAIYKLITGSDGKKDSTVISREEFHQLAQEFLDPDIMTPAMRKNYTPNSFSDRSTKLSNFTYDAKDTLLPVQRLNIRFKGQSSLKMTSLDIIKKRNGALMKMFWKSNRYFHIITDTGNGKYTKTEVVWNAAPEESEVDVQ